MSRRERLESSRDRTPRAVRRTRRSPRLAELEPLEARALLTSLPTVLNGPVSAITSTGATLSATLNPSGSTATAGFEYFTSPTFVPTVPTVRCTTPPGLDRPSVGAVDASSNLYVIDANGPSVKKIAPDGTTTTVGSGFRAPQDVAVDTLGNVLCLRQEQRGHRGGQTRRLDVDRRLGLPRACRRGGRRFGQPLRRQRLIPWSRSSPTDRGRRSPRSQAPSRAWRSTRSGTCSMLIPSWVKWSSCPPRPWRRPPRRPLVRAA